MCVARIFPQLVKLGKSPCWSSHFLFASAGKQATGKTTHSTYLHHSSCSVSSPLCLFWHLQHCHNFLCSVCSFPMSLHAFLLLPLPLILYLCLFLLPLCVSFLHAQVPHSLSIFILVLLPSIIQAAFLLVYSVWSRSPSRASESKLWSTADGSVCLRLFI